MGTPPTPFLWFESVVKSVKMAQIKLTYFNLRARAEPARLVLAYAGAKYDDVRLPAPWDNPKPWAALKPTTPYGQCPLLEWDGEEIAQSMAITRFLAAQFGLKGRNNVEGAQVEELNKSAVLPMLQSVEKRLISRGGQFLVGNNISLADIHLFFFCSEYTTPPMLTATPKIADL